MLQSKYSRAALVFLLSIDVAAATSMTFETAAPGSMLTAVYEQNGIRLTVLSGHYDVWQCASPAYLLQFPFLPCTGQVAGIDEATSVPSSVRVELSNGALFDLVGIEILAASRDDSMSSSRGSSLVFVSGPASLDLRGFQGIRYFDLNSRGLLPGFVFDNIQMNEIPEPQAKELFIIGAIFVLTRILPIRR